MNRVRPVKETTSTDEGYEEPFDKNADALDVGGVYLQNGTSNDAVVLISRDSSNNIVFSDTSGSKTLSALSGGPSTAPAVSDFLLDNEPTSIATNYSNVMSGGLITSESWRRASDSTLFKRILYTYSGSRISTEVRNLYAADGSTIVDQTTITYSYTNGLISGSSSVRGLSSTPVPLSQNDFLLDNEPDSDSFSYSFTMSSGRVSHEQWQYTANSKIIRSVDYTYGNLGRVNTEVRKVYASDGTTVVAQMTITYGYTSGIVSSYSTTRDL